jgi:hypothetical protein
MSTYAGLSASIHEHETTTTGNGVDIASLFHDASFESAFADILSIGDRMELLRSNAFQSWELIVGSIYRSIHLDLVPSVRGGGADAPAAPADQVFAATNQLNAWLTQNGSQNPDATFGDQNMSLLGALRCIVDTIGKNYEPQVDKTFELDRNPLDDMKKGGCCGCCGGSNQVAPELPKWKVRTVKDEVWAKFKQLRASVRSLTEGQSVSSENQLQSLNPASLVAPTWLSSQQQLKQKSAQAEVKRRIEFEAFAPRPMGSFELSFEQAMTNNEAGGQPEAEGMDRGDDGVVGDAQQLVRGWQQTQEADLKCEQRKRDTSRIEEKEKAGADQLLSNADDRLNELLDSGQSNVNIPGCFKPEGHKKWAWQMRPTDDPREWDLETLSFEDLRVEMAGLVQQQLLEAVAGLGQSEFRGRATARAKLFAPGGADGRGHRVLPPIVGPSVAGIVH